MLKNFKVISFVLVSFAVFNSFCSSQINSNINNTNTRISICQKFTGKWLTYRTGKGKTEKDCQSSSCGTGMGEMELWCENDKIIGKHFLGLTSNLNSQSFWTDVKTDWEENNLVIYFENTAKCSVKYKITEVTEKKLFGNFTAQNCKINNKLVDYEEDFIAVKKSE